jgi:hypothetical protein
MSLLTLEPAGLQALATHFEGWSADVAVSATPTVPAASIQATAAARGQTPAGLVAGL